MKRSRIGRRIVRRKSQPNKPLLPSKPIDHNWKRRWAVYPSTPVQDILDFVLSMADAMRTFVHVMEDINEPWAKKYLDIDWEAVLRELPAEFRY